MLIYSDLLEIEVNDTEASASVACCITEQLVAQFCDQGSLSYTRHFQSSCDGGAGVRVSPTPAFLALFLFLQSVFNLYFKRKVRYHRLKHPISSLIPGIFLTHCLTFDIQTA